MSWSPHVTVSVLVEKDGRFLMVEERVNGAPVINQPSGHWERGETLFAGAIRETLEETCWDVELTDLLGIYEYEPPELGYTFIRFMFIGRALSERSDRELDKAILRSMWLSEAEIRKQIERHRSPMVLRAIEDYLAGHRYPLNLVQHQTDFASLPAL